MNFPLPLTGAFFFFFFFELMGEGEYFFSWKLPTQLVPNLKNKNHTDE